MKSKKTILFGLLCSIALVSCRQNPNDEPSIQVGKISVDSFYFYCKINGNPIEIKSPHSTIASSDVSIQRLYKLHNSFQDSTIVGYSHTYFNDNYIISIGIRKCCLLDTTISFGNFNLPEGIKKEVLEKSNYQMEFMPPGILIKSSSTKYSGFYIEIIDLKKNSKFTTYLDDISGNINEEEYIKVSTNSEFNILKSTELNSGIYADYKNVWFIESKFKCKIYKRERNAFIMEDITEGDFKGCF